MNNPSGFTAFTHLPLHRGGKNNALKSLPCAKGGAKERGGGIVNKSPLRNEFRLAVRVFCLQSGAGGSILKLRWSGMGNRRFAKIIL